MGSVQRVDRPKPWLARYRAPDGRQRSRSFKREVDAEKWLTIEESRALRGEWVDPSAGSIIFVDWVDVWLSGLLGIEPKTRSGYESLLRSRVLPAFGGAELRRITTPVVREWIAQMVAEGLSGARIRQARQVLSAALEVAVSDGLIPSNPCNGVKPPAVRRCRQLFLPGSDERLAWVGSADDLHLTHNGQASSRTPRQCRAGWLRLSASGPTYPRTRRCRRLQLATRWSMGRGPLQPDCRR